MKLTASYATLAIAATAVVGHYAGIPILKAWMPGAVPVGLFSCVLLSLIAVGNIDGWRFSVACHIVAAAVSLIGLFTNAAGIEIITQQGWLHPSSSTAFMCYLLLASSVFVRGKWQVVMQGAALALASVTIVAWFHANPHASDFRRIGVVGMALPSAAMVVLLCLAELVEMKRNGK